MKKMDEGSARSAALGLYGLKSIPEDFCVQECLALPSSTSSEPPFHYLRLRKRGVTTFEAVGRLAEALGISVQAVCYAGLKDEDGITEQLVAVPAGVELGRLERLDGSAHALPEGGFVHVEHHGRHDHPIAIGALEGNLFSVVMRALSRSQAETVARLGGGTFYFLNYYDTQRFGVAGGPETTHRIGQALEVGDFEQALALVRTSGSADSEAAQRHPGPASAYFASCDPRRVAFYHNAYASFRWNAALSGLVADVCPHGHVRVAAGEIEFRLAPAQRDVIAVLARRHELPYARHRVQSGAIEQTPAPRDTVVQVRLRCSAVADDELHPGHAKVRLSFFLPSGSYATMCGRQIRLSCLGESPC